MNILILGGTGAMGTHLCQILANGGGIFVTSRRERKAENGVTYLKGNAHEEQFLYTILKKRNWDVIIDFMIYSTDEFRQRADLLLQSTKQYVYSQCCIVIQFAARSLSLYGVKMGHSRTNVRFGPFAGSSWGCR